MKELLRFTIIIWTLILPLLNSSKVSASSAIQHIIIFGDSLSDTGNYPEPANISSPQLKNFNLYVPITNPVEITKASFKTFLLDSLGPIDQLGKINNLPKTLYSVNWPLYVTYQLSTHPLNSWYRYYTHANADITNINYAWASALAGNNKGDREPEGACYHDDGSLFPDVCTADTLWQHRQQYLEHTIVDPNFDKKHHYAYQDIQVPDLGKQVSFYLDDDKVRLKDKTALFIYIGANDIGNLLKTNLIRAITEPTLLFKKMVIEKQVPHIVIHLQQAVSRIETAYKNKAPNAQFKIYLLTMPHFSDLYEGYAYTHPVIFGKPTWVPVISLRIRNAIDNAVDVYNQALKALAAQDADVNVIDADHTIATLAALPQYHQSVVNGTACVDQSGYTDPAAPLTNCYYKNQSEASFFSWNNAHYTASINQQLANTIVKDCRSR